LRIIRGCEQLSKAFKNHYHLQLRIIRIWSKLDRAGQEATTPPPAHNTCTNILQLFQAVNIGESV